MSTEKIISQLLSIETMESENDIKLLLNIFNNILKHPMDRKYRDLNVNRIKNKLKHCKLCFQLLFHSGFNTTNDGKRLVFDQNQTHKLSSLKLKLKTCTNANTVHNVKLIIAIAPYAIAIKHNMDIQKRLMSDGFSEDEAKRAIKMSMEGNIPKTEETDIYKALNQLLEMGFGEYNSLGALSICNNDVNSASQRIIELRHLPPEFQQTVFCDGKIEHCSYIRAVITMTNGCCSDKEHPVPDTRWIMPILDAFNHVAVHHDTDDEFAYISKSINKCCDLENCDVIRRHYSSEQETETKSNNHDVLFQDIFDKIHCHYIHSYDIFRLTPKEQKEINNFDDSDSKTSHNDFDTDTLHIVDNKIKTLRRIIHRKRKRFTKAITSTRYNNNKRFCSNIKNNNTKLSNYSFGWNFNYWQHCKYSQYSSLNMPNFTAADLYIAPKYSSLKEELLSNSVATISLFHWQKKVQLAEIHKKTETYLSCIAVVNTLLPLCLPQHTQYTQHVLSTPYNPATFGYADGDTMGIDHLLSILIYCSFDYLQSKFTETYRPLYHNDNLNAIKLRHQNFHHFAKALRETVEVFGMFPNMKGHPRMYHGIDKEMTFNGMTASIYSVMSTTAHWNVGVQFADNTGLVLELVPDDALKHFDCRWLSPYPNEGEMLFIGGLFVVFFVNITNTFTGDVFGVYIKALGLIHAMALGIYFDNKIYDWKIYSTYYTNIPMYIELKDREIIERNIKELKKLVKYLMMCEYNRNTKYKQSALHRDNPYMDNLLHQICKNKTYVHINMDTMKVDTVTHPNGMNPFKYGYLFLKPYICSNGYDGINLDFIHILFPYIVKINVSRLRSISGQFLNDIVQFLSHKPSNINRIELKVQQEYGFSNILEQCRNYQRQFICIGYNINPGFLSGTLIKMCLIQKIV